jgi:hypothetical protein
MEEDLEELETRLARLNSQIHELTSQRHELTRRVQAIRSQRFVAANQITARDVQQSSGTDRPCFFNVVQFMEWLKLAGDHRRFGEWNGQLYFTSDLLAGKLIDTGGLWEHVPPDPVGATS